MIIKFLKLTTIVVVFVGIFLLSHTVSNKPVEYPKRPINNVVVWSAGGGTDIANRVVSGQMAKILNGSINVSNRPGGVAGSLGMSYVQNRLSDGYTLVGLSESCVTAAVMGGWDQRMDVWYPMIIGGSADLISVSSESNITNLQELLEQATSFPNSLTVAAGSSGSIHHLNLLAFMRGTGAQFRYVPYPGSAPAQTAAVTQEVNMVITSLAEQQQLIKAGNLRPIAMLTKSAYTFSDTITIPSALERYPALSEHLPIFQAIGMAVKIDTPDAIKQQLTDAFQHALQTEEVQQWASDNYFTISGLTGEDAQHAFSKLESLFTWALQDLGATKISPAALDIRRPNNFDR